MDKATSKTYTEKVITSDFVYVTNSRRAIRKGGFEHRKVESASSKVVGLTVRLIKGQSVDLRSAETDSVASYTRKVMRVAGRGNASARQQVFTMLRDEAATRILFENIVPKLIEKAPIRFKITQIKTISSAPARTTLKLVIGEAYISDAVIKRKDLPTGIKVSRVQNGYVLAESLGSLPHRESAAIEVPESEVGQRSIATVEGPVGAAELLKIGKSLQIPVRASTGNKGHWTLGMRSLSADKAAPVLLRVVRRPSDLEGVDIELTWRGKSPSEDLVAQLMGAVEELREELADEAPSVRVSGITPK